MLGVLETEDSDLDLDQFLARVPLPVTEHPSPHLQRNSPGSAREASQTTKTRRARGSPPACCRATGPSSFEGQPIEAVTVRWSEGDTPHHRTWIAGPDRLVVERFLTRVGEVVSRVHDDEVMVFASGCWQRSRSGAGRFGSKPGFACTETS